MLDRVTQTSWMGDATLTVDQTWDDLLVDYSIGRLTAIARHGTSVDYEYDVFGRVTRDGDLTYVYDGNGNRVSVGYPGGTTATFGFDFADCHATRDVQVGVDPPRPVVSAAGYLPSGPLASLTLGNGTVETRDFDSRYYPDAIEVAPLTEIPGTAANGVGRQRSTPWTESKFPARAAPAAASQLPDRLITALGPHPDARRPEP